MSPSHSAPRQCVLLVGGRGTRLGSLTDTTPKPAVPVGGRPFLDYLVENAARHGFTDIILLCGYLSEVLRQRYEGLRLHGATVRCVVEPQPAGTGGALVHARDLLDEQFILANGDTLFDINLLALSALETPPDWVGRIALRRVEDSSRYGIVHTAGARITGFAERGAGGPAVINGGIYLLRRSILDHVGALPCSIEGEVFPRLAKAGLLHGLPTDGFFIDIGIPADLERAQTAVPERVRRPVAVIEGAWALAQAAADPAGLAATLRRFNDAGWLVLADSGDIAALNATLRPLGAHVDGPVAADSWMCGLGPQSRLPAGAAFDAAARAALSP